MSLGPRGRRRLAAALLFSLVLHGVLLLAVPVGRQGAMAAQRSIGRALPALAVRLLPPGLDDAVNAVPTGLTLASAITSATDGGTPLADDGRNGALGASEDLGGGLLPPGESGPPYPPPAGAYRPLRQCESPPVPRQEHTLDFPELQAIEFAGVLTFALLIDADGRVEEVLHERGTLDARIVEAVSGRLRRFRFAPAICQGQPAAVRLRIEVSFGYAPIP